VVFAAVLAGFAGAGVAAPAAGATPPRANGVTALGAPDLGPRRPLALHRPLVGIAARPDGKGYWLAASDGGVFTYGASLYYGSTGNRRLRAPIVDIEAAPDGKGYWLVALDGGVFSFGSARFHGSAAARRLRAPVVGIAGTRSGRGYWLATSDGGVFSFGDARFYGSAGRLRLRHPVVAVAATPTGRGYLLATSDGGVFAFGDARFRGSAPSPTAPAVVDIATTPDGSGYWLLRGNGRVRAFRAPHFGHVETKDGMAARQPSIGIAARRAGGYWIAQGERRVVTPPPAPSLANHPFLVCTRAHESDTSGGYRAVSASGTYRGAYQFSRSTWDATARAAGRLDLVGVDPAAAAPGDQDLLALTLYRIRGASPWGGRCAGK
jgi:hypothetical protein